MPKIGARVIRSPERQQLVERCKAAFEEVRQTAKITIAGRAIAIAETIVANWDHKPEFASRFTIVDDEIRLYIYPTGENAKYWLWTSQGTRAHTIEAKYAPVLIFRTQYNPKTWKGGAWGGPGKAMGDWIHAKRVDHPGTEPRDCEGFIANEIKDDFRREIELAFRRGANK